MEQNTESIFMLYYKSKTINEQIYKSIVKMHKKY